LLIDVGADIAACTEPLDIGDLLDFAIPGKDGEGHKGHSSKKVGKFLLHKTLLSLQIDGSADVIESLGEAVIVSVVAPLSIGLAGIHLPVRSGSASDGVPPEAEFVTVNGDVNGVTLGFGEGLGMFDLHIESIRLFRN
jgi:hypothetical protein